MVAIGMTAGFLVPTLFPLFWDIRATPISRRLVRAMAVLSVFVLSAITVDRIFVPALTAQIEAFSNIKLCWTNIGYF